MSRAPVIAFTLACLSGCATYSVKMNTSRPPGGPVAEAKVSHALWGLGEQEVDLNKLCPQGVSNVTAQRTVGDGFIGALLLGLYQPMHLKVECASATGSAAPDPAGVTRRVAQGTARAY